eukprot:TRINITY_DN569_c5_g1_i1.p1 TRINITY_DN569_c5_g1~~TRINITY_DN569_c5_g1_i1.p1  ORF type:complete len:304 (+),score=74.12 TRINITY_DN569_c5_g1_i1:53-913(+)
MAEHTYRRSRNKERGNPAHKVSVSNIPEYMDEAMLRPILGEVGTVKELQFIYSAKQSRQGEKQRHIGQAFCEYEDAASREAAIRNLPARNVNGIFLVVKGYDSQSTTEKIVQQQIVAEKEVPHMDLESSSPIAEALKKLSLSEVYEAMEQMKQLVETQESTARQILKANPQLSMAILHIFYYMGVIHYEPEETMKRQSTMRHKNRERNQAAAYKRSASGATGDVKRNKGDVGSEVEKELLGMSAEEIRTLLQLDDSVLATLDESERQQIREIKTLVQKNPSKYIKV